MATQSDQLYFQRVSEELQAVNDRTSAKKFLYAIHPDKNRDHVQLANLFFGIVIGAIKENTMCERPNKWYRQGGNSNFECLTMPDFKQGLLQRMHDEMMKASQARQTAAAAAAASPAPAPASAPASAPAPASTLVTDICYPRKLTDKEMKDVYYCFNIIRQSMTVKTGNIIQIDLVLLRLSKTPFELHGYQCGNLLDGTSNSNNVKISIELLLQLARLCFGSGVDINMFLEKYTAYIEKAGSITPIALVSFEQMTLGMETFAYISNVCTHPVYQGLGFSTALLREIMGLVIKEFPGLPIKLIAAGNKDDWGSTLASRMTLYSSLGFVVIGSTQFIKFQDIQVLKSPTGSYTFQKNNYTGVIVGLGEKRNTVQVLTVVLGQQVTITIEYDSILEALGGAGISMIFSPTSYAAHSKIEKIESKIGNQLNGSNFVDLSMRTNPPNNENQYPILCHGILLYTNPLIQIPENIELITFGSIATIQPASLTLVTHKFMTEFRNKSIQSIQALFPPLRYSLKSHIGTLDTNWSFPTYTNGPTNPIELEYFKQAKLLTSDFSKRNIVELNIETLTSSALFYVNALKPGDFFFDMSLSPLNSANVYDKNILDSLSASPLIAYNVFITGEGAPNIKPLSHWLTANKTFNPAQFASPTQLSILLYSLTRENPGVKMRVYLNACHAITDGEGVVTNYKAVKEVSNAKLIDSSDIERHYKSSFDKITCIDKYMAENPEVTQNGGRRHTRRINSTLKKTRRKYKM